MSYTVQDVITAFKSKADAKRAKDSAWFFKTAPGQYGYGDKFIGVSVTQQRQIAKKYKALGLKEVGKLLESPIHEHRLCALLMMVDKFKRSKSDEDKLEIYNLYIKAVEAGHVNNWDLVDSSAPNIVGGWLQNKSRQKIYDFASSNDLWLQRVAVVSTFTFIRQEDFTDSLLIAEQLLSHSHDLIHKAIGWMLREIGKRDLDVEEAFLRKHYKYMPRTMLRYAIEKFPESKRQAYLKGEV